MKNLNFILTLVLSFFVSILYAGNEDPFDTPRRAKIRRHFQPANYYLYQYTMNPAFTGLNDHLFVYTDARYLNYQNFPLQSMGGFDLNFKRNGRDRHAMGYIAAYNRGGQTWSMQHVISYSFEHMFDRRTFLRLGAGVGYDYTEYRVDKLTFGDMVDARYGFIYTSQETFTGNLNKPNVVLNGGINLSVYGLSFNLSVLNTLSFSSGILSSNRTVNAYTRYYCSAFYDIRLTRHLSVYPSVEATVIDRNIYTVEGGAYVHYYKTNPVGCLAGVSYNSNHIFGINANLVIRGRAAIGGKLYVPFSTLSQAYGVTGFMAQIQIFPGKSYPMKKVDF